MTPLAEQLTRGDTVGVRVDAIEREFASLWTHAGEPGTAAVTRACLANLTVWLNGDAAHWRRALTDTVSHVPARVMVVHAQDTQDPHALESYISAHCVVEPGGKKKVCSEEVTLHAGPHGLRHVGGVVRALLVPNVPSFLLTPEVPCVANDVAHGLLVQSDRAVMDSASLSSVRGLVDMAAFTQACAQRVDVGWMGLWGMRSALASVFDHTEPRQSLSTLHTLELSCTAPRLANRLLLVGWLLDRLGARTPFQPVRAGNTWSAQVALPHGPVTVKVVVPQEQDAPMVLRLAWEGSEVVLRRGVTPVAELTTRMGVRNMALDPSSLGERVARAMAPAAPDPLFESALAQALGAGGCDGVGVMSTRTEVAPNASALVKGAADEVLRHLSDAVAERGQASLMLSGGSTPEALYREFLHRHDPALWDRVHLFWGDERMVPADHPDNNAAMAMRAWLTPAAIPAANIHAVQGMSPLQDEVARYQTLLGQLLGSRGADVVLLGMGTDGHTASLFPGTPVLRAKGRVAGLLTGAAAPGHARLTITLQEIERAQHALVLVAGKNKAPMLHTVMTAPVDVERWPVQVALRVHAQGVLWCDQDAASQWKR